MKKICSKICICKTNDNIQEQVRDELIDKLEFDFEMGGLI